MKILVYKKDFAKNDVLEIFRESGDKYSIKSGGVDVQYKMKHEFTKDDLADLVVYLEENITFSTIGCEHMHYMGFCILESNILEGYEFISMAHELSPEDRVNGLVKYKWEKK